MKTKFSFLLGNSWFCMVHGSVPRPTANHFPSGPVRVMIARPSPSLNQHNLSGSFPAFFLPIATTSNKKF
jgi:hypothetical protein